VPINQSGYTELAINPESEPIPGRTRHCLQGSVKEVYQSWKYLEGQKLNKRKGLVSFWAVALCKLVLFFNGWGSVAVKDIYREILQRSQKGE
jgi:hypothetical protein